MDRDADVIGIAGMAQLSGLSMDTLRWYEKEGLIPRVERGPDGRRRFTTQQQSIVLLLTSLRDTGMPTSDMKEFVCLLAQGAASHGRRIALLERNRRRLAQRRAAIAAAEHTLDEKVAHYRRLIAEGLDCDGAPVPAQLKATQAAAS